jgi:hypothetical protein
MEISCYRATALDKQYGFLYSKLSQISLRKLGLSLQDECKDMIK